MKVMNISCFVTEQTKVRMKGGVGRVMGQVLHPVCTMHNCPEFCRPLQRAVCTTNNCYHRYSLACCECTLFHLPSVKTDVDFENRNLSKEVIIKFYPCKTSSQVEQYPVMLFL